MMANKHLHELLKEDQEPFQLKNYIADRRFHLKTPTSKTSLQVKKRKPIIDTSNSRRNLCKQACFFSFNDSPDVRKSPFPDFPSPLKSPCKSSNAVLLHIPARTAALLLEAATRINQTQSSSMKKPKTQMKNVGFGLFGSILKKLKDRNRTKKHEITANGISEGRKFPGKREKEQENVVRTAEKSAFEMGFSCSCNNSRISSAVWSESNEEKSLDLETSSGCSSEDSNELQFLAEQRKIEDFTSCEMRFCSSPLSPFRFSLQTSPSSGRRTPDFHSPAQSPSRDKKEGTEIREIESFGKVPPEEEEEEEDEEEEGKEQCSPVSVLDPPIFDDDDCDADDHEDGEEEGGYDLECSYAIVQKAKQQLLQKLRRFEKLAELDPIELEKRMLEQQDDEDEDTEKEEDCADEKSLSFHGITDNVDEFVNDVLSKSSLHLPKKIPASLKRLVSDLITEEMREQNGTEDCEVAKRVCKRFNSWKEVESNTIDMMIELDFRREIDGWKSYQEQVGEAAMEIEAAIVGLLVEELSEDLNC